MLLEKWDQTSTALDRFHPALYWICRSVLLWFVMALLCASYSCKVLLKGPPIYLKNFPLIDIWVSPHFFFFFLNYKQCHSKYLWKESNRTMFRGGETRKWKSVFVQLTGYSWWNRFSKSAKGKEPWEGWVGFSLSKGKEPLREAHLSLRNSIRILVDGLFWGVQNLVFVQWCGRLWQ